MKEEKKLYSEEAVNEALRLTAMGTAGILDKKDAEETLSKLPEDLAKRVMASTVAAHKAREAAMAAALLKAMLSSDEKESEESKKSEKSGK
jgi:hypothetical protein|nr:MAG TPA: hypothetical protein [Caudoviricetes sp.]